MIAQKEAKSTKSGQKETFFQYQFSLIDEKEHDFNSLEIRTRIILHSTFIHYVMETLKARLT